MILVFQVLSLILFKIHIDIKIFGLKKEQEFTLVEETICPFGIHGAKPGSAEVAVHLGQ